MRTLTESLLSKINESELIKTNEFIGKLNGKTLSFKYDDVANQIYVYQLFKNKLPKELGMEKCLSYEEFNLAVERLKVKIQSV